MSQLPPSSYPQQPDDNQGQPDPDQRALAAMAAAVGRARRENAGGLHRRRDSGDREPRHYLRQETPGGWGESEYGLGGGEPLLSEEDPTWRAQHRMRPAHHHRSRAATRLGIAAGAVLAVLVAIGAVVYLPSGSPSTAVLANNGTHHTVPKTTIPPRRTATTSGPRSTTPPPRAAPTKTTPTTAAPTTAAPTTAAPTTAAPTTAAPTTTTTTTPPSGLHISSVIPASGGPGQLVMIRGSQLFSPDGEVLVRFDGHAAPTDCTTQTICTATVPDLGASGTVQVTVTTQSGTSNGLNFAYTK